MFGIKISKNGKFIKNVYYGFKTDIFKEADRLEAKGFECEVFYAQLKRRMYYDVRNGYYNNYFKYYDWFMLA